MSSLSARSTVGLQQQQSRLVGFLSKPSVRASPTRPWTASFSTHSPGLAAKKPRLLCLAPAFRQEPNRLHQDTFSDLFVEFIKSTFRDLQSVVLFIIKQPKEFRHLEFPSLQTAGRLAILTIAVVMVLIVFLATVDSALSFIVASVFRRIR